MRAAAGLTAFAAIALLRRGNMVEQPPTVARAGGGHERRALSPYPTGPKPMLGLGVLAAIAAILLAILTVFAPQAAGAGWRAGFLAAGSIPIGAAALLLIAQLSGGGWRVPLEQLATSVPLLLLAAVPLIAAQAFIAPPDHLRVYMGAPAFAARTIVALAIWAVVGWLAAGRRLGTLAAALALLVHGVLVSVLANDWMLGGSSGQPYSAIGMVLATQQIVAGTACACVVGKGDGRTLNDLSKLMIGGCLGLTYLLFVDWLIVWYGNLPPRVDFYLARMTDGWDALPLAALALGLLAPIAAKTFLSGTTAIRVAGGCALAGVLLADIWLVGPRGGALAAIAAALLSTTLIAAVLALTLTGMRRGAMVRTDAA
jgi:hypothetical protein